MTEEEKEVLTLLGQAYNKFALLPVYHPDDQKEFTKSIHYLQEKVMCRLAVRNDTDFFTLYREPYKSTFKGNIEEPKT